MSSSQWQYMTPEEIVSDKWDAIKKMCDNKLSECDWTQLPDARITPAKKAEWDVYREYNFTIEQRFTNPDDVVFIDPPIDERTADAPMETTFSKPITAPVMSAEQFIESAAYYILSPDIDMDADTALKQAESEFIKEKGVRKDLGIMSMALVRYVLAADKKIKSLEIEVGKLKEKSK